MGHLSSWKKLMHWRFITGLLGLSTVMYQIHLITSLHSRQRELFTTQKILKDSVKLKKRNPMRQISMIGERNSGTTWAFNHIRDCFGEKIHVERHLTRYKHWFQDPKSIAYKQRNGTLVIAQFRDPYDWLLAMQSTHHHAPNHADLTWHEFLTKPWTMKRIGLDLNMSKDVRCQQNFSYHEVNSCHTKPLPLQAYGGQRPKFSGHKPFYELKPGGSGEPFSNILELRAAKIRNFLQVKNYDFVLDLWQIQYEHLLVHGTKELLDQISDFTGINYTCYPIPPNHRQQRDLDKHFVQHVNEHLDWEAEELIGYSQLLPDYYINVTTRLTKSIYSFSSVRALNATNLQKSE